MPPLKGWLSVLGSIGKVGVGLAQKFLFSELHDSTVDSLKKEMNFY